MPAVALCVGIALAGGVWPFGGSDGAAQERGASRATIRTLKSRDVRVNAEPPVVDSAAQAMDQYRRFLALKTGSADMRAEALRRLADLNLDAGVNAESEGEAAGAGAAYFAEPSPCATELLDLRRTAATGDPADDAEVLYQLSQALEGAGQGDDSLRTLDTLVASHPAAKHQDEAEFRRGETYFVRQNFPAAERAYAAVLAGATRRPSTSSPCTSTAGRSSSRAATRGCALPSSWTGLGPGGARPSAGRRHAVRSGSCSTTRCASPVSRTPTWTARRRFPCRSRCRWPGSPSPPGPTCSTTRSATCTWTRSGSGTRPKPTRPSSPTIRCTTRRPACSRPPSRPTRRASSPAWCWRPSAVRGDLWARHAVLGHASRPITRPWWRPSRRT
jgi:hypothetical protein